MEDFFWLVPPPMKIKYPLLAELAEEEEEEEEGEEEEEEN